MKRIILDPDGFVVIEFNTDEEYTKFVHKVPPGPAFAQMRYHNKELRLSWKLADLGTVQFINL